MLSDRHFRATLNYVHTTRCIRSRSPVRRKAELREPFLTSSLSDLAVTWKTWGLYHSEGRFLLALRPSPW